MTGRSGHPVSNRRPSLVRAASFGLDGLVATFALVGCGSGAPIGSAGGAAPSRSARADPTPRLAPSVAISPPDSGSAFRTTGSLAIARAQQTASLLSTGRVLIAGGGAPEDAAKAELYDPKTGAFSPTGSMSTGRFGATATVLSDGRVLIAGGWSEDPNAPVLASAELYDPAAGTFSPTGWMTTPRAEHTATLLSDGRVLITGGQIESNNVFSSLSTAELYDPRLGTFRPTGSMTVARFNHTATLLETGHVLIAGGGGPAGLANSPSLATAELYDPATGTFTATASMAGARFWHTATLLDSGRVLIAGGNDGSGPLASAEQYDPSTGTFIPAGSMAAGRYQHTATLLNDGGVLVVGGYADGVGTLASAELYDPLTATFSAAGSMSDSRFQHTATLLGDGRVLIAAGGSTDESIDDAARLISAELYQP
jgi:large repetitive protein